MSMCRWTQQVGENVRLIHEDELCRQGDGGTAGLKSLTHMGIWAGGWRDQSKQIPDKALRGDSGCWAEGLQAVPGRKFLRGTEGQGVDGSRSLVPGSVHPQRPWKSLGFLSWNDTGPCGYLGNHILSLGSREVQAQLRLLWDTSRPSVPTPVTASLCRNSTFG